jgi:prepilin-type processing-associated H-X9-DG protein
MRRVALYSSSRPPRAGGRLPRTNSSDPELEQARAGLSSQLATRPARFEWLYRRRKGLLAAGGLFALVLVFMHATTTPPPRELTQRDLDAAVRHTLRNTLLPSPAAKAYEVVRPSVVLVRGLGHEQDGDEGTTQRGIGSGVVIVDKGIILTNLHVVLGAERVNVVFADGHESEAAVVSVQPENDLAVLQAKTIPDDLFPATLRSTGDLALGDEVVAVGFPFGIGPSVSAGVVSGLRREFFSREGKRVLTNLIQFDAAANPGSSGGPLVTADGEVVGIVTAILNPSDRVFIGIGFAVPIENAATAVGLSPF